MNAPPRPRLVFATLIAERAMRRWIDARATHAGVGAAGAGVLFHLERHDDATISEVTAALGASASGMSGLLNRLEKARLIERHRDPHDSRTTRLTLTPPGARTARAAHDVVDDLNALLLDPFTDEELHVVERWLRHSADVLTENPPGHPPVNPPEQG